VLLLVWHHKIRNKSAEAIPNKIWKGRAL
jgi:hypothetical protein